MNGVRHYFVANAVSMVTGLLSLVIFVRVFSPAEYGALSLITGAIGLAVIVGTAGLPQSAVRFHWSMEARGREGRWPRRGTEIQSEFFVFFPAQGSSPCLCASMAKSSP